MIKVINTQVYSQNCKVILTSAYVYSNVQLIVWTNRQEELSFYDADAIATSGGF